MENNTFANSRKAIFWCCRMIFLSTFIPYVYHGASWLVNNKPIKDKELIILSGCMQLNWQNVTKNLNSHNFSKCFNKPLLQVQ